MKFSVFFISLITIYILPMTFSKSSKPVPGCSACTYYASIEEDCQQPNVPVNELPENCTSYIYLDVKPDASFNVAFGFPNVNNDEYLKSLLGSGKPTFLYYNHPVDIDWISALENGAENAKTEMANLKTLLEPYKNISGLILGGFNILEGITDTACITENVIAYLDEMKACFPEYSIGFELFGLILSEFNEQPNPPAGLDFCVLDPYIDFYVISVIRLNDCTAEYKVGGDVPINGNAPYTIDKVRGYATLQGVPEEKTYYMFRIGPNSPMDIDDTVCDRTNEKLCASSTLDGYCSDTTQSYYDKGAYAKKYGVGFIAMNVDLSDDPYGYCECGGPYPAFRDMLAGFNGDPVPPTCSLLDKC